MARWVSEGRIRLENGLVLSPEDVVTVADMKEVVALMMSDHLRTSVANVRGMVSAMIAQGRPPAGSAVRISGGSPLLAAQARPAQPPPSGGWEIAMVRHVSVGQANDPAPVPSRVPLASSHEWAFGVTLAESAPPPTQPSLMGVIELRGHQGLSGMIFSPDGGATLIPIDSGGRYAVLGAGAKLPPLALTLALDSNSSMLYDGEGGIATRFGDAGMGGAYFVAARRAAAPAA